MIEYEHKLLVTLKGTVLSIEATDRYPFTFGYVSGDSLRIVQLEDDSAAEQERMAEVLRRVPELSRPFYTYEAKKQEPWLGCPIDHDLADIWQRVGEQFRPPWTRWCDRCGWIYKWDPQGRCSSCGAPGRDVLRELQPRPTAYIPRGLGPPGKEGGTARWWQEYLGTKQPYCLFVIALKNQADLLAGCCLVVWQAMGLPPPPL